MRLIALSALLLASGCARMPGPTSHAAVVAPLHNRAIAGPDTKPTSLKPMPMTGATNPAAPSSSVKVVDATGARIPPDLLEEASAEFAKQWEGAPAALRRLRVVEVADAYTSLCGEVADATGPYHTFQYLPPYRLIAMSDFGCSSPDLEPLPETRKIATTSG